MPWTADAMPPQDGLTHVITGANSGIGFEAARALAARGATVVMACRNASKAADARDAILAETPSADLHIVGLDLANLESVRDAATELQERFPRIDRLINNAGLIGIRGTTADGFEMQLGVNHLGHFALTGHLLDHMIASATSRGSGFRGRIVSVASIAHRWFGWMRWKDLMWERSLWSMWPVYGQSKLANLLFMYELDRRLGASGVPIIATGAHPGMSETHLIVAAPEARGANMLASVLGWGNKVVTQSAEMGALPTLHAATHPDAQGADYIGPSGFLETRGYPVKVSSAPKARRARDMRELWERSVELTGVSYDALVCPDAA